MYDPRDMQYIQGRLEWWSRTNPRRGVTRCLNGAAAELPFPRLDVATRIIRLTQHTNRLEERSFNETVHL